MKKIFLYIPTFFLLTACVPGHLMVKEADLKRLELRLQKQEERLALLSGQQADQHSALRETYYATMESHHETLYKLQGIAASQGELMQRQQAWETFVRSGRLQREADERAERAGAQQKSFSPGRDKQVVGEVEKVFLSPPGTLFPARIDTGATTSSLDARHIEHFERNGEAWVRFTVVNPGDDSEVVLESKVVRNVRIIQAVVEDAERRPVVELGVTVGRTTQTAQFTLSDRRHLEYPVLIGRNILKDIMVVDVSQSHIAPPAVD